MIADHGCVPEILRQNRIDNPVPFVPGEIDIDVGWILTSGVEKTFEVEIVFDRADVCDPHAVSNQRRGAATPTTDARAAGHNILNHQEVGRKTHLPDDA